MSLMSKIKNWFSAGSNNSNSNRITNKTTKSATYRNNVQQVVTKKDKSDEEERKRKIKEAFASAQTKTKAEEAGKSKSTKPVDSTNKTRSSIQNYAKTSGYTGYSKLDSADRKYMQEDEKITAKNNPLAYTFAKSTANSASLGAVNTVSKLANKDEQKHQAQVKRIVGDNATEKQINRAKFAGELAGSLPMFAMGGGGGRAVVSGMEGVVKATTKLAGTSAMKKIGASMIAKGAFKGTVDEAANYYAKKLVEDLAADAVVDHTMSIVDSANRAYVTEGSTEDKAKAFLANQAINVGMSGAVDVAPAVVRAIKGSGALKEAKKLAEQELKQTKADASRLISDNTPESSLKDIEGKDIVSEPTETDNIINRNNELLNRQLALREAKKSMSNGADNSIGISRLPSDFRDVDNELSEVGKDAKARLLAVRDEREKLRNLQQMSSDESTVANLQARIQKLDEEEKALQNNFPKLQPREIGDVNFGRTAPTPIRRMGAANVDFSPQSNYIPEEMYYTPPQAKQPAVQTEQDMIEQSRRDAYARLDKDVKDGVENEKLDYWAYKLGARDGWDDINPDGTFANPILHRLYDNTSYDVADRLSDFTHNADVSDSYPSMKSIVQSLKENPNRPTFDIVEEAYSRDGKSIPEWYRKEEFPTKEERIKSINESINYYKGVNDYILSIDKSARKMNPSFAKNEATIKKLKAEKKALESGKAKLPEYKAKEPYNAGDDEKLNALIEQRDALEKTKKQLRNQITASGDRAEAESMNREFQKVNVEQKAIDKKIGKLNAKYEASYGHKAESKTSGWRSKADSKIASQLGMSEEEFYKLESKMTPELERDDFNNELLNNTDRENVVSYWLSRMGLDAEPKAVDESVPQYERQYDNPIFNRIFNAEEELGEKAFETGSNTDSISNHFPIGKTQWSTGKDLTNPSSKSLVEAVANNPNGALPDIIEEAFARDGRELPEVLRKQYYPSKEEAVKRLEFKANLTRSHMNRIEKDNPDYQSWDYYNALKSKLENTENDIARISSQEKTAEYNPDKYKELFPKGSKPKGVAEVKSTGSPEYPTTYISENDEAMAARLGYDYAEEFYQDEFKKFGVDNADDYFEVRLQYDELESEIESLEANLERVSKGKNYEKTPAYITAKEDLEDAIAERDALIKPESKKPASASSLDNDIASKLKSAGAYYDEAVVNRIANGSDKEYRDKGSYVAESNKVRDWLKLADERDNVPSSKYFIEAIKENPTGLDSEILQSAFVKAGMDFPEGYVRDTGIDGFFFDSFWHNEADRLDAEASGLDSAQEYYSNQRREAEYNRIKNEGVDDLEDIEDIEDLDYLDFEDIEEDETEKKLNDLLKKLGVYDETIKEVGAKYSNKNIENLPEPKTLTVNLKTPQKLKYDKDFKSWRRRVQNYDLNGVTNVRKPYTTSAELDAEINAREPLESQNKDYIEKLKWRRDKALFYETGGESVGKGFSTRSKNEYFGFDVNKATNSFHDNGINLNGDKNGKRYLQVEMSPDEYIERCQRQVFKRPDVEGITRADKDVDRYAEDMKNGDKFPVPYLNFSEKWYNSRRMMTEAGQEGLHRAEAAKRLGIDKIPVTIIDDPKNPTMLTDEVMEKALAKREDNPLQTHLANVSKKFNAPEAKATTKEKATLPETDINVDSENADAFTEAFKRLDNESAEALAKLDMEIDELQYEISKLESKAGYENNPAYIVAKEDLEDAIAEREAYINGTKEKTTLPEPKAKKTPEAPETTVKEEPETNTAPAVSEEPKVEPKVEPEVKPEATVETKVEAETKPETSPAPTSSGIVNDNISVKRFGNTNIAGMSFDDYIGSDAVNALKNSKNLPLSDVAKNGKVPTPKAQMKVSEVIAEANARLEKDGEVIGQSLETILKTSKDKAFVDEMLDEIRKVGINPSELRKAGEAEADFSSLVYGQHAVKSMEEAYALAKADVEAKPYETCQRLWNKYVNGESINYQDALSIACLQSYAERKGLEDIAMFARQLRTNVGEEAGRTLRAFGYMAREAFNDLSPAGKQLAVDKQLDKICKSLGVAKEDIIKKANVDNENLVKKLLEARGEEKGFEIDGTEDNISFIDVLMDNIKNSEDAVLVEKSKATLIKALKNSAGTSLAAQLNAWRYLSMLSNPATHERNIIGNALAFVTDGINDFIDSGIQNNLLKRGLIDFKTSAILTPSELASAYSGKGEFGEVISKYVKEDALHVTNQGGGMYERELLKNATKNSALPTRAVAAGNRFVGGFLEAGDRVFIEANYRRKMAEFLKANGYGTDKVNIKANGGHFESVEDLITQARRAAMSTGAEATYRGANAFSQLINKYTRAGARPNATAGQQVSSLAVSTVMPFATTTSNIAIKAFDLSPAGLLKAAVQFNKAKSLGAEEYIKASKTLAAGTTGTGITLLGVWLGLQGSNDPTEAGTFWTGKLDKNDPRDAELMRQGFKSYSICNIDENGKGTSVPLSWLPPVSMSLFIGVQIGNILKKNSESEGSNVYDQLANYATVADSVVVPFVEMSMMQSLNDALDSVSNSEDISAISAFMGSIPRSAMGQFIPQPLAKLSLGMADGKYELSGDAQTTIGRQLQYDTNNLVSKIPVLSKAMLPMKIDGYGNVVDERKTTGDKIKATAKGWFDPSGYSKIDMTEGEKAAINAYDDLVATGADPDTAKGAFATFDYSTDRTIGKSSKTKGVEADKIHITPKERAEAGKAKATNGADAVEALLKSKSWNSMLDSDSRDSANDAIRSKNLKSTADVVNYVVTTPQYQSADAETKVGILKAIHTTGGEYSVNKAAYVNQGHTEAEYDFKVLVPVGMQAKKADLLALGITLQDAVDFVKASEKRYYAEDGTVTTSHTKKAMLAALNSGSFASMTEEQKAALYNALKTKNAKPYGSSGSGSGRGYSSGGSSKTSTKQSSASKKAFKTDVKDSDYKSMTASTRAKTKKASISSLTDAELQAIMKEANRQTLSVR